MMLKAKQSEYEVTVRGWNGPDFWKKIDARVVVRSGDPVVIFFDKEAAFTITQLEQIVTDLKEIACQSSSNQDTPL